MVLLNIVFGYEFLGEIVEIGNVVVGNMFFVGDWVMLLLFIKDQIIGLGEVIGVYVEFVKVDLVSVVWILMELDDLNGVFVEFFVIGLYLVKMVEGVSEKQIFIIGVGLIGLVCVIWCCFFGVCSVVISEMLFV